MTNGAMETKRSVLLPAVGMVQRPAIGAGKSAASARKILIFGDSVLKGVIYDSAADRYRLSAERGFSGLEARRFEVKNYSRMGAVIRSGRESLEKALREKVDGSTVIFEFGGNDCDFVWKDVSENPDGNFLPRVTPEEFEAEYAACVREAREAGARVMMTNLIPIDASRYLNFISRGLDRDGILRWLGDESMLFRWHEKYCRIVERLARRLRCPLIDVRTPFLESHKYKELICDDGIHPTDSGHRLIRSVIGDAIMD